MDSLILSFTWGSNLYGCLTLSKIICCLSLPPSPSHTQERTLRASAGVTVLVQGWTTAVVFWFRALSLPWVSNTRTDGRMEARPCWQRCLGNEGHCFRCECMCICASVSRVPSLHACNFPSFLQSGDQMVSIATGYDLFFFFFLWVLMDCFFFSAPVCAECVWWLCESEKHHLHQYLCFNFRFLSFVNGFSSNEQTCL